MQYFRRQYNYSLKYTHWPCLQAGNPTRPTYLPMEVSLLCLFVGLLQDIPDLFTCYYNVLLMQVCNIAKGQRYSSKLNEHQVRNILRLACVRPAEREERTLGVNTITNPTCDCTFYFLFHMFFLIHTISFVFIMYKHLMCILRYSRRTIIPLMIMQKNLALR